MGHPAASQNVPSLADIESPVLSDAQLPDLTLADIFQQPAPQPPLPAESNSIQADTSKDEYRAVVKSLGAHKHQYVHCKLKTGKIVTGQITDAGFEAFSVKTNILGEHHYVRYDDLAEAPRPVHAVGTRFKQAVQWAGVGALVAVAVPVLVILSPLLYFSGAWQC